MGTAILVVCAAALLIVVFRMLAAKQERRHRARADALALLGVARYPAALGRADLSGDRARIGWELAQAVLEGPRGATVDWRASPADVLEAVAPAVLAASGAHIDVHEEGDGADTAEPTADFSLTQTDATTRHRARRRDVDESTDTLVAGVARLIPGVEVLAAIPCRATDTSGYVFVTRDEDARLRALLGERYTWVFGPVAAEREAVTPVAHQGLK